jgi:ATP-dependent RNA helicase DeaD
MVRLFITVGSRDNVRPGDLVGAITNSAGITGSEVGKVDVRESHSTVEVAQAVADVVVEKLTGTMIKGRRAIARVDKERPRRSPDERGSSRPPARSRGPREQGGARGERGDRFGKGDRTPRGAPRRRDHE